MEKAEVRKLIELPYVEAVKWCYKDGPSARPFDGCEKNIRKAGLQSDDHQSWHFVNTGVLDSEYAEFSGAMDNFHGLLELCDIMHKLRVAQILEPDKWKAYGIDISDQITGVLEETYGNGAERKPKIRQFAIELGDKLIETLEFLQQAKIYVAEYGGLRLQKFVKDDLFPGEYTVDGETKKFNFESEWREARDTWEMKSILKILKEKKPDLYEKVRPLASSLEREESVWKVISYPRQ